MEFLRTLDPPTAAVRSKLLRRVGPTRENPLPFPGKTATVSILGCRCDDPEKKELLYPRWHGSAKPTHRWSCVVNQMEMLHQMCQEVLTEADVRAICKNRGLPNQAASSRSMLETLCLSDAGVAVAMRTLDRTEIALLHLLRSQDKPVDVTFCSRLDPPRSERWSHGTFSQRFQGVFSKVKDRLVRGGILLLALGPESLTKKTKMERWQFALPVQFARHLLPLLESAKRLSGEGSWRRDVARVLRIPGRCRIGV